tara:strand:+ start:9022 stop:9993 length:972 start_codon:yes stop_codon:yes gene_type:complete
MPQNLDLDPIQLPVKLRFNEEPVTEFKNNLESLRIELVDYPNPNSVKRAAYRMVEATWADHPVKVTNLSELEISEKMEELFSFKALPNAMETFGFTFLFGGIDLQTVTHLIRHRAASWAAQCTGDRFLNHEACLVPSSVENSPEFYERWKRHVQESKELYADMADSRKISLMDARCILPKCLETFYYGRFNMKDLLGFIRQRQDKQIQPEVDNIIAAMIAREIINIFPEAHVGINLRSPSFHYAKNFRSGTGTNLYWPDGDTDKHLEYHPNDTIYQGLRDDLNGTHPTDSETNFRKLWNSILSEIDDRVDEYKKWKEEQKRNG